MYISQANKEQEDEAEKGHEAMGVSSDVLPNMAPGGNVSSLLADISGTPCEQAGDVSSDHWAAIGLCSVT